MEDGATLVAYADGTEVNRIPYSGPLPINSDPLEIGRDIPGSTEYIIGAIDEVRIYIRALSSAEVLQLYTLGQPTLNAIRQGAKLVFSWPANSLAFTLVSATNLGAATIWTPVSPAPVIVDGQYVVTNSTSGPIRFFRLRTP